MENKFNEILNKLNCFEKSMLRFYDRTKTGWAETAEDIDTRDNMLYTFLNELYEYNRISVEEYDFLYEYLEGRF